MSFPARIVDSISNALTGLRTRSDAATARQFTHRPLTSQEIEAAFNGSGLMRKVVTAPAEDSVREWRNWQAEEEQIKALQAEERRLDIRSKVELAEIYRGLGGGAIIMGVPGDTQLPLNANAIKPGDLKFLHVVSRYQVQLGQIVEDTEDPLFGSPANFRIQTGNGQMTFHPSRVICFKGQLRPVINSIDQNEMFWGQSKIETMQESVMNSDNAQAAFSSLIDKARNTEIGIPGLSAMVATEKGEQLLQKRLAAMMLGQSTFHATIFDAGVGKDDPGEEITHKQVNWAGIPAVMLAFAEYVAAIADMPMTRLFGRAPEGLNSSGDSQQKDWNKKIRAHQELKIQPCIDLLDTALIPSAGVKRDDITWDWAALDTPSEKEETDRFKIAMEAAEKVQNTGAVPDHAFAKSFQNLIIENSWMPGIAQALADIPDDERYGISPTREGAFDLGDAKPRSLYVMRRVVNVGDFEKWAKSQGIELQDDLHVTIAFSRQALDWMRVDHEEWNQDEEGQITIKPGGVRIIEPLGDRTAVLLFTSSTLTWRHEQIIRAGASHDYPEYQPHISLTGEPVDIDSIEPYRGEIVLGPEIFEELDESRA